MNAKYIYNDKDVEITVRDLKATLFDIMIHNEQQIEALENTIVAEKDVKKEKSLRDLWAKYNSARKATVNAANSLAESIKALDVCSYGFEEVMRRFSEISKEQPMMAEDVHEVKKNNSNIQIVTDESTDAIQEIQVKEPSADEIDGVVPIQEKNEKETVTVVEPVLDSTVSKATTEKQTEESPYVVPEVAAVIPVEPVSSAPEVVQEAPAEVAPAAPEVVQEAPAEVAPAAPEVVQEVPAEAAPEIVSVTPIDTNLESTEDTPQIIASNDGVDEAPTMVTTEEVNDVPIEPVVDSSSNVSEESSVDTSTVVPEIAAATEVGAVVSKEAIPAIQLPMEGDSIVINDSYSAPEETSVESATIEVDPTKTVIVRDYNHDDKAILVTQSQGKKLRSSKEKQRALVHSQSLSLEENVTEQQLEDMLSQLTSLYEQGKTEEAEAMSEQISILSKKLKPAA